MAKKSEGKISSFADLNNVLADLNPDGGIMKDNDYSSITEWIDTGQYLFNAQLSGSLFGGMPNARSIALAGDPGTGKTFLALNMCRQAQKKGYNIIYVDTETAVDRDVMLKFGLDLDRVRYEPITEIEVLRTYLSNLCTQLKQIKKEGREAPKIMVVLDSLGNMVSSKEKGDAIAGGDKRDMTKQQAIRSLFRVVTMDMASLKIPFVINNHLYESMGMFGGKEMGGGGGLKYNVSIITFLSKSQLLDESNKDAQSINSKVSGVMITSNIKKNRFARPSSVKFHISFYKGMNPYVGLEEYIGWNQCGVEIGNIITHKEFEKLKPGAERDSIEKTKYEFAENDFRYFVPGSKMSRTLACKHLGIGIPKRELFTDRVFTKEVLELLDNNVIKDLFRLPDITDTNEMDELEDLLNDENE